MKKHKHKQNSEHGHEHKGKSCCGGSNSWLVVSVILAILFVASLVLGTLGVLNASDTSSSSKMSQSQADAKAREYVALLSDQSAPLVVSSVVEEDGLYTINVDFQGQREVWYMSLDGDYFFPNALTYSEIQSLVGGNQGDAPTTPPAQEEGEFNVNLEGANTLGSGEVLMVEYSSATCPFCSRYYTETFSSIESEYVDTNKITYVYKHFTRNDVDILAANAMECAGEQDAFFEFKDYVYRNQQSLGQEAVYSSWAEDLGLDVAEFDDCFSSRRYSQLASENTQEGQLNGVTGTPGFLVGSRLIAGAQPFANFKSAIDAELAN
ncbi:MAG: DsbA family protein [Candidatus Woesearchaeota archaeon]